MPPLPRGTCPVCGGDVALRKGNLLREHVRADVKPEPKFQREHGRPICPGSSRQVAANRP